MLTVATFAQACSGSREVLQTGVNEVLTPKTAESMTGLEDQRKPDPTPYFELQLDGPTAKADIVRAVNQHRKDFDRCYRSVFNVEKRLNDRDANRDKGRKPILSPSSGQRLEPPYGPQPAGFKEPTLDGDVTMHFIIGQAGAVHDVRTSRSDLRDDATHLCLEKVVQGFKFPAQATETKVKFLVLRFSHDVGFIRQS